MFRPLRSHRRLSPSPCRGAFTLIELMVVVAIIVILTAITLPAVKALTQGNSQKQAVNLVSALLANARAVAITSHKAAGVVFYEDQSAKSQTAAQVVVASYLGIDGSSHTIIDFVRAPGQGYQLLPYGVKVGTLSSSTTVFNTGDNTGDSSIPCRIVLFDENGQLLLTNRLFADSKLLASDSTVAAWNFVAYTLTTAGSNSSPAVVIYDGNALQAAAQSGKITNPPTAASVWPWMEQNADILVVNSYTGNIIR
jgi:prepilin-type N-terminal cleavage/methylation domain-containing protein